ncbi:MAG: DUF4391 domain-containing protein [Gemmatimonadetes bacterium]|nr:DUF4391 domain-containing protein [Gemmatimonadota bacterium]
MDSPGTLAADVIAALALPAESRVDQRIPKKLFLENGAPTAADRKRIQARIDEVTWVAVLKPATVAIPLHRSAEREYLEIAVLWMRTRDGDGDERLPELVHRAIPYPVLLLSEGGDTLSLSLAHKRWSLGDASRVVLDGPLLVATLHLPLEDVERDFVASLGLSQQRPADLKELYDGWLARAEALAAARVTRRYVVAASAPKVSERREALERYGVVVKEIAELRLAAERERQVNRRVELNLIIRRLEQERAEMLERI